MRLIAVALGVAAVVLAAVFGLASSERKGHARRAPELPAAELSGGHVTLPALLAGAHGGPVLVVFWASWCGPCRSEAPAIERVATSAAGRGRVVGVDWSDGAAEARQFVHRYGWTFPNLSDPQGTVGNAYRITGLPTTFVIGAGGAVERELHGPQDQTSLARALQHA